MAKFKKGDKVKNIGYGNGVEYGIQGTVTEDDTFPYVRWSDKNKCPIEEEDLELIEDSTNYNIY